MDLLQIILEESLKIDQKFIKSDLKSVEEMMFVFDVNKTHNRYQYIRQYQVIQGKFDRIINTYASKSIVLIDENIIEEKTFKNIIEEDTYSYYILQAQEGITKTILFLDSFIKEKINNISFQYMIVIGLGLLSNCAAYIAEKLKKDLILIPTTVLAMADNSGGKVRINHIDGDIFYKHKYKSFYEPNEIIIDKRFLDCLDLEQKKIGLVEIIKHAVFQSQGLYNYLTDNTEILKNNDLLLKAILRALDLKRVCVNIDVDETPHGSKSILRAGHDISDKIEEELKFTIPHGYAVAKGIIEELKISGDATLFKKATKIFDLFHIPY